MGWLISHSPQTSRDPGQPSVLGLICAQHANYASTKCAQTGLQSKRPNRMGPDHMGLQSQGPDHMGPDHAAPARSSTINYALK